MNERVDKYRTLCETENSIPLFSQAWWLDTVAGKNNWDVVIIERDKEIIASMPYLITKSLGLIFVSQPKLTQSLGPWIKKSNSKYAKRLSLEKDLMNQLIDKLPEFDSFHQNWNPNMTNWLPFFWKGFTQTTRYTYVLPLISDPQKLWEDLQENIRTDIKKAQNKYKLIIRSDLPIEDFIKLQQKTFKRQNISMPIPLELIERLDQECTKRNIRKMMIAVDEMGRHHAGIYIVWDHQSAYYLMSGGDPSLRNSGATSYLLWEAIKFASSVTASFDFEGSMIEPIERFFRAFGAKQTPYFSISKINSRRLRIKTKIGELISCLK
ncbi:MAG: GNAT family N-acetyltransferase [Microcystis aeruginosa Ma_AC_P_19900807_S300]|nr:MAG: GNAT family N-acetyltransferase [Microcystis aeruginosa Ma_AC_P_19900807_S300]